ncbi:MAG: molybdopterin-binding protein [Deltaproteobacteria bacterium]|nr:MAG: molybdopterin-binding protein [Deltaproteobacteria bacterium]RPJ42406.1 MAG: molybdopterin-binding protein [Deltaproteobacteria bacterium]
MIKKISLQDAVGKKLAHDLTQIIPGKFKGAAFRKGQVIRKADIPRLLDMGKKQIYVLSPNPGELHEDEAARRMGRAMAGRGVRLRGPREGKIEFLARTHGILRIHVPSLEKINALGALILAARHNGSSVRGDDVLAGTRVIPLVIRESKIKKVEEICRKGGPVLEVFPFRKKQVGIVVTGSEIFEKRIADRSVEIVKRKVEALGSKVKQFTVTPDDPDWIAREIRKMRAAGCQVIVATGGLSVDPDDATLNGIRRAGAQVIFYGVPVLPGSMSAYARLGRAHILGAPACLVHEPITAFDLFLAPLLADLPLTAQDAARFGHGGLCLRCPVCHYPACSFGNSGK